jgi:hypothetical protein
MKEQPVKTYPTLGCCGLDCGLCPRYHTEGESRCPGCCGSGFFEKHPSCGFITCCVKKKGLEVCAQCDEFPCTKTEDSENVIDSFLTHRKTLPNLNLIKEHGIEPFLEQQKKRIEILHKMMQGFNDGRSKGFFYISATLLPLADLETAVLKAEKQLEIDGISAEDMKSKALILRRFLTDLAEINNIELKLRKKKV